ncbi:MAG TPA: hypothetical protein VJ843_00490 [Candidatus Saccharimonadales bacterium]|nr:hypothetical protein [Candidatus Saccharimonadales bacterium]
MNRGNEIKPKLKDFTPFALPTPRWYLPLGIALEVIAWATLAIGFYYVYFLIENKRDGVQFLLPLIGVIVGFILSSARSFQINTQRKLLDTRQPILYLRPFFHDRSERVDEMFAYSQSTYSTLMQHFLFFQTGHIDSVTTTDEAIAKTLKDIGPVVAVGVPLETMSPPGSLRLYFKDEEWRDKVEKLMSISRSIIIQPGYTPSLEWEMDTAKHYFQPEQICFSLLDWRNLNREARKLEFETFNMQVKRIYGISLPKHFNNAYLIYFDNTWTPIKVTVAWWPKIYLFMAFEMMSTTAVREILRPVLQKQGIRLSIWQTAVFIVITHAIYGVIFYYFVNLLFRRLEH